MNLALLFFAFAGAGGDLLPSGLTPEMIVTQVRAVRPDCEPAPTLDEAGFLLDTNYLLTRCAWQQSYPAAASSGETLLVAWQDHRGYFQDDIYACRVTSSGLLLDSAGILISSEPWNQQRPAVSYDG
ncbi:MAG: hypothetical protein ABIK86_08020, partial [candidate division WOR-3 bacterium]